MKKIFLLYIVIILPGCSATYINEQNLAYLEYGMEYNDVCNVLDNQGMLEKLEATESGEYKCISYYINHNKHAQLSLAYLNGKLITGNLGSNCQKAKFTNSKKLELDIILDSWVHPKEEKSVTVGEIFIAPFFLMAQLGTKDSKDFIKLNTGTNISQIISDFGKPHCNSSTDDNIEIVGYDTTRGFTSAGYTLYFVEKKLLKIEYGQICNTL